MDLAVKVTPRSSRNRIERLNGQIRVWVTAAPTDGQANEAVIQFLAKALDLAPSKLKIIRGDSSRDKLVRIESLTQAEVESRLKLG